MLGLKPNEIFKTTECDEIVYKLDDNLQGYYFNLEEGDFGIAHIKTDWQTDPILLSNLLTGAVKRVPMTAQERIFIKELYAKPIVEKTKEENPKTADDFWAQLNKAIMDEAQNQFNEGNHAMGSLLGSYVSPEFR